MRVAFLRGINVGGHQVRKDTFRQVFAALGHAEVTTFIASGNVLFEPGPHDVDAPDAVLERAVAAALEAELGWAVPTFVRTPEEIAAIARRMDHPELSPAGGGTLYVEMTHEPLSAEAAARVHALAGEDDVLRVEGREIYWLCRTSMHTSKVAPRMARALGVPSTNRNLNTLVRLAAKLT